MQQRLGTSTLSRWHGDEWGFLDAFCVIFRAPPVVPELSASFSSFRVLTTVSARGLQLGLPISYSDVVDIHTHLESRQNNNNNNNNNTNNNNKAVCPKRALVCVTCGGMDLSGQPMVARASGAAQRRKLRRLRAALRHEQQSIAMALASALHHSADKTSRAQYNAPRGQKNAGTEYYALSDDDEVPVWGSRPPCLGEPRGPQERDQARTVDQIAV